MTVHERTSTYALGEEVYYVLDRPVSGEALRGIPEVPADARVAAVQYRLSRDGPVPRASVRLYGPSALYAGGAYLSTEELRLLFADRLPVVERSAPDADDLGRVVAEAFASLRRST